MLRRRRVDEGSGSGRAPRYRRYGERSWVFWKVEKRCTRRQMERYENKKGGYLLYRGVKVYYKLNVLNKIFQLRRAAV